MEQHPSTTPFGRRSLKLAHVASQIVAKSRPPEKVVHKWNIFRTICTAKARIGVSERTLAVLEALLSFHPETPLTGEDLVVFPSNRQLALRAHGMAPATLRRHLAALVDSGLIIRRDSPNGKRYARKGKGGEIALAFGFDLSPIVARADEFEAWAEEILVEERALKLARERITICRRDIVKMIAVGMDEGVPTRREGQGPESWSAIHAVYCEIISRLPRTAPRAVLENIADELSSLADEIIILLETHIKTSNPSANESQSEHHKQNSNPNPLIELEPDIPRMLGAAVEAVPSPAIPPKPSLPLGMVIDACPDILDYAKDGVRNWRDLLATAAVVRTMLGISPSAWEEAQLVMGEVNAAIVVAAILQRAAKINSPGGYLRELTRKAQSADFSIGPMLMALLKNRQRERRPA